VTDYRRRADHDALYATHASLWTSRSVRIRVLARLAEPRDVERLAESLVAEGDGLGWLVHPHGSSGSLPSLPSVELVTPAELIHKFERSSRVAWNDRRPAVAMDRLADQRSLFEDARLLDPVGMRWLPVTAHNELPPELVAAGGEPQDWLERLAFRLLSHTFRFGGRRYGEAARGRRVPDALLLLPSTTDKVSALVDCKSSADGYTMAADHYLRFKEYERRLRAEAESAGHSLQYMIVVSSTFAGSGRTHPFHARRESLAEETGLKLVYVRAIDLAVAAAAVERADVPPADREALRWSTLFDAGLVGQQHFQDLLQGAGV
jgi:hypothetical protein